MAAGDAAVERVPFWPLLSPEPLAAAGALLPTAPRAARASFQYQTLNLNVELNCFNTFLNTLQHRNEFSW